MSVSTLVKTHCAVPVSDGRYWAIVDADDYDKVAMHRWTFARSGSRRTLYAQRKLADGSTQMMHNFIAGLPFVDHANHDGLDNRRQNLRDGAGANNARNARKTTSRTSSAYKGVSWRQADASHGSGWQVNIRVDGRQKYIGKFDDEVQAAWAYDAAATQYYGEFACLNFPVNLNAKPGEVVGYRKDGRPIHKIAGGAEDDPEAKKKAEDEAAAKKKANDEAAAKKKADDEAEAKKKADDKKSGKDDDLGYPKDTPVAEMTVDQREAYWRHHSRTHEDRHKALRKVTGDRTPEQIQSDLDELEKLRREKMSDSEKAVEDAKKKAEDETAKRFAPKAVAMAFQFALADVEDDDERQELIDDLDLSKFLKEDGDVDTAKVKKVADRLAPAGKDGAGKRRNDYGGGRRDGKPASGTASGRERYQERHGKKEPAGAK